LELVSFYDLLRYVHASGVLCGGYDEFHASVFLRMRVMES
jgi:hypothetical protein